MTKLSFVRVVGAPGAFTEWGMGLVGDVLTAHAIPFDNKSLQDAAPVQPNATPANVQVLLAHGPLFSNPATAQEDAGRTIVFLEEPVAAYAGLVANGYKPRDALSAMTATLAPLPAVLAQARTLFVQRRADMAASEVRRAIAAHLNVGALSPGRSDPLSPPPAIAGTALPADAMLLVEQSLLPLANHVLGFDGGPLTWPLACFVNGDRPNEAAIAVVDLLGPRRVLYYGPYYHMPRGTWRVEAEFYFSDANSTFFIDVFTHETLAHYRLLPPRGGVYVGTFDVTIPSAEDRVEIRLWLERGAIEGQAGLRRVTFHAAAKAW